MKIIKYIIFEIKRKTHIDSQTVKKLTRTQIHSRLLLHHFKNIKVLILSYQYYFVMILPQKTGSHLLLLFRLNTFPIIFSSCFLLLTIYYQANLSVIIKNICTEFDI